MAGSNDMFKWYEEYYSTVEKSSVYSRYCERVFGNDFSQQGFSNMEQISEMLRLLEIRPNSTILDIGCGNGKLIEYISDITDSVAYGFDYSPTAIEFANKRTTKKKNSFFEVGSIGVKQYAQNTFDAVIAIDTIYFADDICRTLKDIDSWLKQGGKMAVFYSEFRFNENESIDKMQPYATELAKAFESANMKYKIYDFTQSHYEHMKLKQSVALELRREFETEGTMILFNNIYTESINENTDFTAFKNFSARYLYIYEKI